MISMVFSLIVVPAVATDILTEKEECLSATPENGVLLYETLAVTQEDLNSGFQNYAATAATTSFGLRTKTIVAQDELANVVGMVIDYDTEEPVVGATVYIDGNPLVMTDGDGRFQIEDVVQGTYDWSVTSAGYCTAYYLNYDVDAADGATIFAVELSRIGRWRELLCM